jgi:hypothetical protein
MQTLTETLAIDQDIFLSEAEVVDEYVALCAEERAMKARKEKLQKLMDGFGERVVQGTVNRVTIVGMPGNKSVDVKGMVAEGLLTQATVDAFTKLGTPFKQYRVGV